MSTGTLRPARTTTRLGLPVPADSDPADYVTYTGNLADAIDRWAATVPVIAPSALSSAPYNAPYPGQTVDLQVAAGIIWRVRWQSQGDGYGWQYIGGNDLIAADSTVLTISTASAWQSVAPTLMLPRPGIYYIEVRATVASPGSAVQAYIDGIEFGQALGSSPVATGNEGMIVAPASTIIQVQKIGITNPLAQNTFGVQQYATVAGTQTRGRSLTVRPVRIS